MKENLYNFCEYKDKYFDILYKIKKEGFKWYVEKIYGWNEEVQINFFKNFIEEHRNDIKVIKFEGKIIGIFTNYNSEDNENFIDLFCIDKKYQGKGIGTKILEEQLKKDKENKVNTVLQVFKENKARFLYEKVGFKIYEETETHYKMRRKI